MWWLLDYTIHPEDAQIAFVCTGLVPKGPRGTGEPTAVVPGGVFRTLDGGQSWERVLSLETPAGPEVSTGSVLPRRYRDFVVAFAPFFDLSDPTRETVYVTTQTHGTWLTRNALDAAATPLWKEHRDVPFTGTQRMLLPADATRQYTTTFGAGVWRGGAAPAT